MNGSSRRLEILNPYVEGDVFFCPCKKRYLKNQSAMRNSLRGSEKIMGWSVIIAGDDQIDKLSFYAIALS